VSFFSKLSKKARSESDEDDEFSVDEFEFEPSTGSSTRPAEPVAPAATGPADFSRPVTPVGVHAEAAASAPQHMAPRRVMFTIDQAIKLVDSYPKEDIPQAQVAGIMRRTLEAMNIQYPDLIEQAHQREAKIEMLADKIREKIHAMHKQIESFERDLETLQARLEKTASVREFLELANEGFPVSEAPEIYAPQEEDVQQKESDRGRQEGHRVSDMTERGDAAVRTFEPSPFQTSPRDDS